MSKNTKFLPSVPNGTKQTGLTPIYLFVGNQGGSNEAVPDLTLPITWEIGTLAARRLVVRKEFFSDNREVLLYAVDHSPYGGLIGEFTKF
jgi:hypothetical protein